MIQQASDILLKLDLIDSDQALQLSSQLLLESYTESRTVTDRLTDQKVPRTTEDQQWSHETVVEETCGRAHLTHFDRKNRTSGVRQSEQSNGHSEHPPFKLSESHRNISENFRHTLSLRIDNNKANKSHFGNEKSTSGSELMLLRSQQLPLENESTKPVLTSFNCNRHVERPLSASILICQNKDIDNQKEKGNRDAADVPEEVQHDSEISENSQINDCVEENHPKNSPGTVQERRKGVQQEVEDLLQELDLDTEVVNTVVRCIEKRNTVVNLEPKPTSNTSEMYPKYRST